MTQKTKILVVDDEPNICQILKRWLDSVGYEVETAPDGYEALKKVHAWGPDLVISDIRMPRMDGVELIRQLKLIRPDIPVIALSGLHNANIVRDAMKEGAYDYLFKPFDFEEAKISIDRALERRRLYIENLDYQKNLEKKVAEQAQKIRSLYLQAVQSLAIALEEKDRYTHGHSQRVSQISEAIGEKMGFDAEGLRVLRLGGLLHDIGKIGIPESILNKPGKLSKREYDIIKTHPAEGERILRPIIEERGILQIVRHHHERMDGSGYPDRLKGDKIPLVARIAAVADAFDALTSERAYRKPMEGGRAIDYMISETGTHFDPQVMKAFTDVVREQRLLDHPKALIQSYEATLPHYGP